MDVETNKASQTNCGAVMTAAIEFRPGSLPEGIFPVGFGCPVIGEHIYARGAVWFVDETRNLTPWSVLIVKLTRGFVGEAKLSSTMHRGSE